MDQTFQNFQDHDNFSNFSFMFLNANNFSEFEF